MTEPADELQAQPRPPASLFAFVLCDLSVPRFAPVEPGNPFESSADEPPATPAQTGEQEPGQATTPATH